MSGEAATVTDEPRRCLGTNQDGTPCGVGPELVLASGWCFTHDAARRSEHRAGATRGERRRPQGDVAFEALHPHHRLRRPARPIFRS